MLRLFFLLTILLLPAQRATAETKREMVAKAIAIEDEKEQRKFIRSLAADPSPEIGALLEKWKNSEIFKYEAADGTKMLVTLDPKRNAKDSEETQLARKFLTGEALKDAAGNPLMLLASDLNEANCDDPTRQAMKVVVDRVRLNSPDWKVRQKVAEAMGADQ